MCLCGCLSLIEASGSRCHLFEASLALIPAICAGLPLQHSSSFVFCICICNCICVHINICICICICICIFILYLYLYLSSFVFFEQLAYGISNNSTHHIYPKTSLFGGSSKTSSRSVSKLVVSSPIMMILLLPIMIML